MPDLETLMLDGIETGYEEHYDFPLRERAPDLLYVLAAVPRSGSSYFSHLLWQTGCLGAPLEYLNFLPASPYGFAHGAPEQQTSLWRSLLHRRTSPNGIFGLKCFPRQLRDLQSGNPALCVEVLQTFFGVSPKARVIRLRRRDKKAHAISLARASLTGIWRKEQEPAQGVSAPYSREAVESALQMIDGQESEWDRLFAEVKPDQLELWYEEVLAAPDQAVARVADFLGVRIDPAAAFDVPQVEKQSASDSRLWAERYNEAPS